MINIITKLYNNRTLQKYILYIKLCDTEWLLIFEFIDYLFINFYMYVHLETFSFFSFNTYMFSSL